MTALMVIPQYHAESITHKPTYIFTRSPSSSVISGSLKSGEKWQTQLFTEIHVGKAIPGGTKEKVPLRTKPFTS